MSFAYNTPIHFIPGIGKRTADILHNLGIHTAGQFKKVPESILIELFGPSIRQITNIVHVKKSLQPVKYSAKDLEKKQSLMKRMQHAWQFVAML